MELSPLSLEIVNRIRINGFEVDLRPQLDAFILSIYDPNHESETSITITCDNEHRIMGQLSNEYCSAPQRQRFAQTPMLATA